MANELENDDFEAQPRAFPKEMMADLDSQTVGHQVRDYLWGKGPIDYEIVAGSLDRRLVLKFVEFEMQDLPPQNFWRVRILADLYALRELLTPIGRFLNRDEKDAVALDRSIAGTIIFKEIGDESHSAVASEYYDYLVSNQFAGEKIAELLNCLAAFGNEKESESLKKRADREVRSLSTREAGEPEAGIEKRYLEDLANNEFFLIDESNKSRSRIDAIEPAGERLDELIRAYLCLTEDDGAEYFQIWNHQQIRRYAENNGRDSVILSFRKVLGEIKDLPAGDRKFCRIRSLNAIEFFGGKLTDDEFAFLEKNRVKQLDPIHLIEVPPHFDDPEPFEEEIFDAEEMEGEDES
jgi:hypothetical protein